jgi:predicted phosphate transport protein (TIGR00153 family)
MFGGFIPKEGRFFELFKDQSNLITEAAVEFRELLAHLDEVEKRVRNIKDIEHKGDEITHTTMDLLHQTFITPLDREDIHELSSTLDDVLDFIDAAAQRVLLFEIKQMPNEGRELAEVCVQATQKVQVAVGHLDNLKDPTAIKKLCVEINRLENEADHILRAAVAKLFRDENDIKNLIKLKEVYEILETVTDLCEDVANIIDGIVLEYA